MSAGDYNPFASQVENGFLDQRFAELAEYGIPRSAIAKIAKKIPDTGSVDALLDLLRRANLQAFGFSRYEMTKVLEAF